MRSEKSSTPKALSKSKYLVSAAAAVMLAACSTSSERFASTSSNPSDVDPVYTASVPKPKKAAAPVASDDDAIASRPLAGASVRQPTYTPPPAYDYQATAKKPSYKQPTYQEPEVLPEDESTAEAPAKPAFKKVSSTGATVKVRKGMTLYSIAKANGVTVAQLATANRIKPPYNVAIGRTLIIPGASEAVTPEPKIAAAESSDGDTLDLPVAETKRAAGTHKVVSGETLFALGRKYKMSPYAIAEANGLERNSTLKIGQLLRIPSAAPQKSIARITPEDETGAGEQKTADATPSMETPEAGKSLAAEEIPQAEVAQKKPEPATPVAAATSMRWPVRGKIISGYGSKPNGLKNEGINIAVPEGTGIRAAESGVVAYAGNELKGYGNLILIRHEGGWVTAYAHAKELFVKRGDTVKRGDVIAKAGQTGSVTSPQLHFEVRKGATAMDPLKFLGSATASN
jgi:murein DD-endopeptidase MepM/ murein hydrolase activator NlpD